MPTSLLVLSEIYFRLTSSGTKSYAKYVQVCQETSSGEVQAEQGPDDANVHGRRVLAVGIFLIGVLIGILALLADFAQLLVGGMGVVIIALAFSLWPWSSNRFLLTGIKE
jgi:hypothetical protein